MSTYVQFKRLRKCYGPLVALSDINLRVDSGSVLALLGPNGAGKSTLFGCLLGFVRATAGSVVVNGEPLTVSRAAIGYMPERVALYPQSTVRENGAFFAELKSQPVSEFE